MNERSAGRVPLVRRLLPAALRLGPFVAVVLAWAIWPSSEAARGPIAETMTVPQAPTRLVIGTVAHITSFSAPARLLLDSVLRRSGRVLFYVGRSVQQSSDRSVVVDSSGTTLAFDRQLRARPLDLQTGTRRLVSAAPAPDGGLWVADVDGEVLRLDAQGEIIAAVHSDFTGPHLAADEAGDGVWASRAPTGVQLRLPDSRSPIIEWLSTSSGGRGGIGTALIPEHGLLADLANAGDIVTADGVIYFAPFVRDEVVAMTSRGDTLWVAHRGLPQARGEPRFEVKDGHAFIDYHPVNLGLSLGPDRALYVLSTPGFSTTTSRLDVFDLGTGDLLRSVALPTALPTLIADAEGRVAIVEPLSLLTGTAPRLRPEAPSITLPRLGGGEVSLAQLRGRVVLINAWASWCAPCRAEMPALAALAAEFDTSSFALVALNEDTDTSAAAGFLRELDLHLNVALGRGRMQPVLHYPGLPYTILVDREGRVAGTWIGQLDHNRLALLRKVIKEELDRTPGAPTTTPSHHHMAMGR